MSWVTFNTTKIESVHNLLQAVGPLLTSFMSTCKIVKTGNKLKQDSIAANYFWIDEWFSLFFIYKDENFNENLPSKIPRIGIIILRDWNIFAAFSVTTFQLIYFTAFCRLKSIYKKVYLFLFFPSIYYSTKQTIKLHLKKEKQKIFCYMSKRKIVYSILSVI